MVEEVEDINVVGGRESCLLVISERMCSWRRSGGARRRINKSDGIVGFGDVLDVCIVRRECLRVVLLSAVFLLVLSFRLLLFVEFALILLVFCYA